MSVSEKIAEIMKTKTQGANFRAWELLPELSQNQELVCRLFAQGHFNEIAKGYFALALERAVDDRELRAQVMRELCRLLSDIPADDAREYYVSH